RIVPLLLLSIVITAVTPAVAQEDMDDLLKGSVADAEYLTSGYISPMLKAFGTGLNAGWNNTAKPHKTLGFDLTITVSPVFIPSSDKTYTVDNSKLSEIQLQDAGPDGKGSVPTIFGKDERSTYYFTDDPSETFDGPPGLDLKKNIGLNALPMPMVQLGVGIYKNTDLKFRFVPQRDFGDFKVSLFGIGVLHDVKQWIPGLKLMPFDLSGFVGFTKFKFEAGLEEPGQVAAFDITATTIQGLISKKISVLTVYGGAGYNISNSSVNLKGTYELDEDGTTVTDPFSISAKASGPRVTAGFRLKLAVITLHADYTLQKYSTLTAGFGIAVR
ncbi:MAG TPA: DUF6588 family protein, partial [Cyclobacteriaceae bacterium]|nr:DUF6588 family protein [Cyclobacteriaceae bacterium]